MNRASVVVIGGGVIGTSAAFHLAEAGARSCCWSAISSASGSTSKAAGGVRAQFSDPLNIEIAARSLEAFRRSASGRAGRSTSTQVGYLFLLTARATSRRSAQRRAAERARRAHPDASRRRRRRAVPADRRRRRAGRGYSPDDGHARPRRSSRATRRARERTARTARSAARSTDRDRGDEITAVHRPRHGRDRHGDLRRGRVVARVRGDGGRRRCR